jgi:hypothetical protein
MSQPGIGPGPPAWEASTLEKSHLDSLFADFSEPVLELRSRSARGLYIIMIIMMTLLMVMMMMITGYGVYILFDDDDWADYEGSEKHKYVMLMA